MFAAQAEISWAGSEFASGCRGHPNTGRAPLRKPGGWCSAARSKRTLPWRLGPPSPGSPALVSLGGSLLPRCFNDNHKGGGAKCRMGGGGGGAGGGSCSSHSAMQHVNPPPTPPAPAELPCKSVPVPFQLLGPAWAFTHSSSPPLIVQSLLFTPLRSDISPRLPLPLLSSSSSFASVPSRPAPFVFQRRPVFTDLNGSCRLSGLQLGLFLPLFPCESKLTRLWVL